MSAETATSEEVKNRVARNFGDRANDYNRFARVQRDAATRFSELTEDFLSDLESPYLELGCGTGFVTQLLVEKLKWGTFYITDISSEMLQACRRDLKQSGDTEVVFELRDAEEPLEDNRYGLIVTALTAQWFADTRKTLGDLLQALKPGGVLIYSYLDSNCFPEWKALCAESGVPFTGNELPPPLPVGIDPDYYCWEFFTSELFTETYESPAEFFRNLKRIGAGTQTSGQRNNPGAIVQLNEHWERQRKSDFKITYGITFGAIRRKKTS